MLGCNRFCSMNGFCFQADRRSTSLGGDAPRRGKGEREMTDYFALATTLARQDWARIQSRKETHSMERQSVSSSNIASVGHDAETNTLEVEFNSGAVWQYASVPQETYEALVSAVSVGKAFNSMIKGQYQGRPV